MGKGSNASKINKAREMAAKRAAEEGKGGGGSSGMASRLGTNALTLQCAICKTAFLPNQTRAQLSVHSESKHPKETFEKCYPDYKG